jgi:DNA integrity scanning protein DisA with diadenylate cyclase activity
MGIQAFIVALNRWVRPALDVAILSYLIYATYRLLIKTQAVQLAKGAALLVVVYAGAFFLKLETLSWVLSLLAPGLVIALAIIFQPELRKIFIKLGQGGRGRAPPSSTPYCTPPRSWPRSAAAPCSPSCATWPWTISWSAARG